MTTKLEDARENVDADVLAEGRAASMCPYLSKDPSFECRASETGYLLSTFEVREYCMSITGQRMCPYYCRRRLAEASELLLGGQEQKGPRPMRGMRKERP